MSEMSGPSFGNSELNLSRRELKLPAARNEARTFPAPMLWKPWAQNILEQASGDIYQVDFKGLDDRLVAEILGLCDDVATRWEIASGVRNYRHLARFVEIMGPRLVVSPAAEAQLAAYRQDIASSLDLSTDKGRRGEPFLHQDIMTGRPLLQATNSGRGESYELVAGSALVREALALGSGNQILDVGSGYGAAIEDLYRVRTNPALLRGTGYTADPGMPMLLACTADWPIAPYEVESLHEEPRQSYLRLAETPGVALRVFVGQVEKMARLEIDHGGQVDMIMDIRGAFYYSKYMGLVLLKYSTLLAPGGKAFIGGGAYDDPKLVAMFKAIPGITYEPGHNRSAILHKST